jgi:hypothetical protein
VIRKNGSKTPVFEVEVDYSTKWQKDHWKAIESTYASAPFFESYDREIKDLIFSGETNLIRFNNQITRSLLNFIDIDLEINYSEHYISIVDGCDFRKWDFEQEHNISKYTQVFQQPNGFTSNLSILDLLFAEGPLTRNFLLKNELTIGSN